MDNKEAEKLTSIGEYSTILKNGETITYYLENPILNREQTLSIDEKNTQELGKETINELEDTKYMEETETTINEMQEEIENSQNK